MDAPKLTENQRADLHRIQVRPTLPTERERWNILMQAGHDRGFRTMAGVPCAMWLLWMTAG
ncbi:MAG: hypothetical protein M0Z43_07070 [Acidithiobacillus sp.]|nr:hypothetical protein [Acidithiobacillus sp.]